MKEYVFRELVEKNELKQFMKLRFNTYQSSSKKNLLRFPDSGLDLSQYDIHAKHYGLFSDGKPEGFIRAVFNSKEYYNPPVLEIASEELICTKNVKSLSGPEVPLESIFPMLSYPEASDKLKQYFKNILSNNEAVFEPGRLMLFGKHDPKGYRKSLFMVECLTAFFLFFWSKKMHAIIYSDASHENFYKAFGFQNIEGGSMYYKKWQVHKSSWVTSRSVAMVLPGASSPLTVPSKHYNKYHKMIEEYQLKNRITRIL